MPINKLVARIVRDAREQVDRIADEAQKKREEILAEADEEARALYDGSTGAALRAAEEDKKQKVTVAGLEARKELLAEKQALIREAFEKALETVEQRPADEYLALMAEMLASAAAEGAGEVLLSPRDRERMGESVVAAANRILGDGGRKAGLKLSPDTQRMRAGFTLRFEGVELNNSLDALVESRREELERKVVEILFGGAE